MFLWTEPASAFRALEFISGMGCALASLEFLALRREFSAVGFYSGCAASAWRIVPLHLARVLLALWFALFPVPAWLTSVRLAALVALSIALTRLMPLGLEAADQMITILLAAQLLVSLAPGDQRVQRTCLAFVASQAVLSYSVAGWAKLLKSSWRSGSYLQGLLRTEMFGHHFAARLLANKSLAQQLSLALITVECAFPLALITGIHGAAILCVLVLCMHLANAYLLGLNLFVWAFGATYPAIVFTANEISRFWTR
jgi:hypothetical protein